MRAAQVAATCESGEAAARKATTAAGLGLDYQVLALPPGTGHGIGMDGHAWTDFVRGNQMKIVRHEEWSEVLYGAESSGRPSVWMKGAGD